MEKADDTMKEINVDGITKKQIKLITPFFRRIFKEYDHLNRDFCELGSEEFNQCQKSLFEKIADNRKLCCYKVTPCDDVWEEYLSDALIQTRKFEVSDIKYANFGFFKNIWEKITGKRKKTRILTITLNEAYFNEVIVLDIVNKMINRYNNVISYRIIQKETEINKDLSSSGPLFGGGERFMTFEEEERQRESEE